MKVWNFGGNGKRGMERREITGIATADDEERRGGGGYIVADERAESRVALVPVEQRLSFLNVAGVPVVGISVIVRLAARHVPHRHLLPFSAQLNSNSRLVGYTRWLSVNAQQKDSDTKQSEAI